MRTFHFQDIPSKLYRSLTFFYLKAYKKTQRLIMEKINIGYILYRTAKRCLDLHDLL